MSHFSISKPAYSKIVLHSLKFPSSSVHGVLLGTNTDPSTVRVTDAVPIGHASISTSAMLDIALQQISIYAQKCEIMIVGYYASYENINQNKLCISVSENSNFKNLDIPTLNAYTNPGSGWTRVSDSFGSEPPAEKTLAKQSKHTASCTFENSTVIATTKKLVQENAQKLLHDFDDHLGNVSLDWLQNSKLNNLIQES
ncbi:hypothetical protein BB559_003457 [Furculomyces boomerangus]|uniref:MPN domain-containing protein n=2 Tax=Harpellales TaxID=61421 RepID=A0A2T9YL27_9FUNG|nr:hypothetical protein BB559_003457 [Furculomyces boomerangus]PWA01451.1 hypothetical protein BB558_002448 [Smittium angustum]